MVNVPTKSEFRVPLEWFVELDNCPSPEGLPDAVGDRYLCRHNPIFAAIRRAALRYGYRFSAEDTPLWRDYQAFSLMTLHRILESKTIPYLDNGNCFRRLTENHRGARIPPDFLIRNLRSNHAFHESAHGVAHAVLGQMRADGRVAGGAENEERVVEAILAESFANTVEALGSTVQRQPLSDAVFYGLNSYMAAGKRKQTLMRAAEQLGDRGRFTLLFLAYFEANLAAGAPDDELRGRIARVAGCDLEHSDVVKDLINASFGLNKGFRDETTPIYFALLGRECEYGELKESRWLEQPDHGAFARELAERLFSEISGELSGAIAS
ncbi:MAG TPA: hypothetical protein VHB50_20600 [Bryobacteraceae bacterium]|nr:hypothetical protein [Bryobacteraceae bacterium]